MKFFKTFFNILYMFIHFGVNMCQFFKILVKSANFRNDIIIYLLLNSLQILIQKPLKFNFRIFLHGLHLFGQNVFKSVKFFVPLGSKRWDVLAYTWVLLEKSLFVIFNGISSILLNIVFYFDKGFLKINPHPFEHTIILLLLNGQITFNIFINNFILSVYFFHHNCFNSGVW